MKRGGPLARRTPLKASKGLRRTRMKESPTAKKRREEYEERMALARPVLVFRSRGRCEGTIPLVCTGWFEDAHHRILRSRGGDEDPENLIALCAMCHRWVHDHPKEATELGLMASNHDFHNPVEDHLK